MTVNNKNFREQFNTYRKLVSLNQSVIARNLGMSSNRFSEKLTGHEGANFDLLETKQIIKFLAQHHVFAGAEQASTLLHTLYPGHNFTDDEWQIEPLVSLHKHQNQNIVQDYNLLPVIPVANSVMLTTNTTTTITRAITATATNIEHGTLLADIQTIQPNIVLDIPYSNSAAAIPLLANPPAITDPSNQAVRKLPPKPLTKLVGRAKEIDTCLDFLTNKTRLLTLTGLAGAGKTRLVTEVVYKLDEVAIYEGDIVFIPLVHVKTSTQLAQELCATFSLPLYIGEDELIEEATRLLVNNLRARHMLLVLDNFEQIVDDTAVEFLARILQGAPNAQMIVTSRESLRREFERLLELEGLPLPPKDEKDLAVIARYGAIELFLRQVRNSKPDFIFDSENARLVVDICYKLDGMPLALELVAAQTNPRPLQQIWSMLSSSSAASTKVYHNKPLRYAPRHQSLFDALDSSYELLSDEEKSLFRRLSVFTGSTTLEAIIQICYEPVTSGKGKFSWELKINELLNSLFNKSLIKIVPGSQDTRYFLLEMPKQFAWFCLQEEDGEQEVKNIQERYAGYYLALVEQAAPAINQHADAQWIDLLLEDKANLLTVLDYLVKDGQVVQAYQMGAVLGPFWFLSKLFAEGVEQTNAVLSMIACNNELPDKLLQARFLHQAGRLNNSTDGDRVKATSLFSKAEKIWRELNDEKNLCLTLSGLGAVFYIEKDYEQADRYYEESAKLARKVDDDYSLAIALGNLTNTALIEHNYQAAKKFSTEGLATEHKLNNELGVGRRLKDLGFVAKNEEEYDVAKPLLLQSLDIFRKYGNYYSRNICQILLYLSNVNYAQKDYAAVVSKTREGLLVTQENSFDEFLPFWALNVALLSDLNNKTTTKEIAILLGIIDELSEKHSPDWTADEKAGYEFLSKKTQLVFSGKFLSYKDEGSRLATDALQVYYSLYQILDKILV